MGDKDNKIDKKKKGLDKYVSIRYLQPEEITFHRTEGGFLSLKIDDKEKYSRVNLHRAFPFTNESQYISVRDIDGKEIGIIKCYQDFSRSQIELILEDLERRYFTPTIIKINSIKEEFGYAYWDVETDSGPIRFTVRGGHQSVVKIDEDRIIVVDVDGNRYEIDNLHSFDMKSLKKLEIYL